MEDQDSSILLPLSLPFLQNHPPSSHPQDSFGLPLSLQSYSILPRPTCFTGKPLKQIFRHSSLVLGPNGLRIWGSFTHVCCLRRLSRQGPMRVSTEIISGKYMRRFWKEIYL